MIVLIIYCFYYLLQVIQGFKPKSINDIKVGMKVLFAGWTWKVRGTVRYVGPVYGLGNQLGVELDPGQGEYWYMNIEMFW